MGKEALSEVLVPARPTLKLTFWHDDVRASSVI